MSVAVEQKFNVSQLKTELCDVALDLRRGFGKSAIEQKMPLGCCDQERGHVAGDRARPHDPDEDERRLLREYLERRTDRPEDAQWLAPAERAWLSGEMRREREAKAAQSKSSVWGAVRDPRVLLLALVYAGTSTGLYAIGIWAPMIIHRFGFGYFELGLVNAIPNLFAVVTMVLWARNSSSLPCAGG